MHDQPVKPLDSAIYWTEYVIRHRGAPHFRSAALDLSWYQYHMVDIALFLIGVIAVLIYAISRLLKLVISSTGVKQKKLKTF